MMEMREQSAFGITVKELRDLLEAEKDAGVELLNTKYGGVVGVGRALQVQLTTGINTASEEQIRQRIECFGENVMPTKPPKSLFELVWEALQDFTLIMLLVSAAFSIGLGIYEDITHHVKGWVEGVAILFSVLVVVSVSALNDFAKEKQFRKLNAQASDVGVNVIRNGKQEVVSIFKLLVGDIVEISVGDILPADGILIEANDLRIDESSLTGESDLIKKSHEKPFLLSNTKVMEGSGKMLVVAIGANSQAGVIKSLILTGKFSTATKSQVEPGDEKKEEKQKEEEEEDGEEGGSVLQTKLEDLAILIGKIGTAVAVLAVLIMTIRLIADKPNDWGSDEFNDLIRFFITGITILVVAVPEGLPLAVTLALAFSVQKMLDDKNLVKHLDACETMGSATTICSDKTGTLTTNRMSVMASWIGGENRKENPTMKNVTREYSDLFARSISINSTGRVEKDDKGLWDYIGNKTECGMIKFLIEEGCDYMAMRQQAQVVRVFPFSSKRKRMSTVVRVGETNMQIFTKGASEIILGRCAYYLDAQGTRVPMTTDTFNEINSNVIEAFASNGLRTLCIAYKDVSADQLEDLDQENEPLCESNMICLGILGIEDPVRPEVPPAIEQCRRAGIMVRMVTGDNLTTAISIARKCGIIPPEATDLTNLAMEGPVFRRRVLDDSGKIKQDEFDKIWPHLRVLARSSPADKFTLVTGLLETNLDNKQVVAVTGDGTNDAPALKKADVGFAMGIQGTSVAKDACDIILTDDNFTSIVKAVRWGRNVYDSIGKFLQFQLAVNVVAITIAFIGSVVNEESPLKAVQLLWVNLIMDSFASLALATEPPTDELLNRKPYPRDQFLISARMATSILGTSVYQLVILFTILYSPESFDLVDGWGNTEPGSSPTTHFTVVFNTFVLMQLFNEFNARNLHGEWNPFRNLQNNWIFSAIWVGTFVVQIIIIYVGGKVFGVKPLDAADWGICLAFGVGNFFWGILLQFVPDRFIASILPFLHTEESSKITNTNPNASRRMGDGQKQPPSQQGSRREVSVLRRGSSRVIRSQEIMQQFGH